MSMATSIAASAALPTAADLAPLHAVLDVAYPERLREIAEQLFLQLMADDAQHEQHAEPITAGRAQSLALTALRQVDRLCAALGGGGFYLPKGIGFRLSVRDREMCAKFNGRNLHQLAIDYRLSDMRVRQIVDAWQLERFTQRQTSLPL